MCGPVVCACAHEFLESPVGPAVLGMSLLQVRWIRFQSVPDLALGWALFGETEENIKNMCPQLKRLTLFGRNWIHERVTIPDHRQER